MSSGVLVDDYVARQARNATRHHAHEACPAPLSSTKQLRRFFKAKVRTGRLANLYAEPRQSVHVLQDTEL